jgi:aminomethyltransferase
MLSLQGPQSSDLLLGLLEAGSLPEPRRNELSSATIAGRELTLARTGYTGEPLCFELFAAPDHATIVWDLLVQKGAVPCGLGARDTLRLEAALPLYGHELGTDLGGREIPVFSCPLAAFAVSFSALKSDFVGRDILLRQHAAYRRILTHDYSLRADLPRMTRPVAIVERGVARTGSPVFKEDRSVGWVTSGTMVPYWRTGDGGMDGISGDRHDLRSICLAYLDCDVVVDDRLTVEIRGRTVAAVVVPHHLRGDTPPYAHPVIAALS